MAEARLEAPLPPGSTIGILGDGQLGRMLAIAAAELGFRCNVFASRPDAPACHVAHGICGELDDIDAVVAFSRTVDVVTFETENIPLETAEAIASERPLYPPPRALAVAQDRLREKLFAMTQNIPTARFGQVDGPKDLERLLPTWDANGILKTRRFGYDGKGQLAVTRETSALDAWLEIGEQPAVLEAKVAFSCELSAIVARGLDGTTIAFDVPRNEHSGGILRRSLVPSGCARDVEAEAVEIATALATALDYVGVLAVELFVLESEPQRLLLNEIAPRVHNSGHWTMDACIADQFEAHVRAITGWPLVAHPRLYDAEMVNLIGDDVHQWRQLAADPGARLHIYGKRDPRPGRKMGHVNRLHRPGQLADATPGTPHLPDAGRTPEGLLLTGE